MSLDAAVRQAYREDPQAARLLLREVDTWKAESMRWLDYPNMPWTDFLARVKDLVRASR